MKHRSCELKNRREKFSVPYNWDDAFLGRLKPFLEHDKIAQFYGRVSSPSLTAGRALCELKNSTKVEVEEHLRKIKESGVPFNYLYNGTVFLENEFDQKFKKRVREEIEWLSKRGVEWLTVANPYLIRLIRESNPEMKIDLSILAHVDSLERLSYFVEMGVEAVCLDWNTMRDFDMMERVRQTFPELLIILLVNDPCLKECPYVYYHDNLMSLASLSGRAEAYPHYCTYACMSDYAKDPYRFLSALFIRPEETESYYDALGPNVLFKLADRNRPTEWIVNVLNAYARGEYEGNLLDLLSLYSPLGMEPLRRKLRAEEVKELKQLQELWDGIRASLGSAVHINNSRLDGFLELFRWEKSGCKKRLCTKCNRCRHFAERRDAITIEAELLAVVRHNLELILKGLYRLNGGCE